VSYKAMASRQQRRVIARNTERLGDYVGGTVYDYRFPKRGKKHGAHERSRFKGLIDTLGSWQTQHARPTEAMFSTDGRAKLMAKRALSGDAASQFYCAWYNIYRRSAAASDRFGYNEQHTAWDMMRRAASAGHVYAIQCMAEYEMDKRNFTESSAWFGEGAALGHPESMYRYGQSCEAIPGTNRDREAAKFYRLAGKAGHIYAALRLRDLYLHGRGVTTRSKQLAIQCLLKAAENGMVEACWCIVRAMYNDQPYARKVGLQGYWRYHGGLTPPHPDDEENIGDGIESAIKFAISHWMKQGHKNGGNHPRVQLEMLRTVAQQGDKYCSNDHCDVQGHLQEFKVCRTCKASRYCGAVCQLADWNARHKDTCRKYVPTCLCHPF
jgi:hypothetical protein